jgi:hypothetical protein
VFSRSESLSSFFANKYLASAARFGFAGNDEMLWQKQATDKIREVAILFRLGDLPV